MQRYALKNDQWEKIEPLLPGKKSDVGVTAKNNRLFIEAVIYHYKAWIAWRDLPERFGNYKVIHTRFSRLAKKRIWETIFKILAEDSDHEYAMIVRLRA